MYVVAGVTGHTGKAAAECLLERNAPVRVVVRSQQKGEPWKQRGAEIAVADFEDAQAMTRALTGATGAYLLIPPNYSAEDYIDDLRATADALASAIRTSCIPHVVFLSSIGAHLPSGTGPILTLRYAEAIICPAAKNITVLRPAYFLDNWSDAVSSVVAEGKLHSFLAAGRQFPMISTTDVGQFAAESLLFPACGKRVIELEGPRDYANEDIAAAFSTAIHRPVHVVAHPPEAIVPAMTASGLKPSLAALLAEMIGAMNTGLLKPEGGRNEFRRGNTRAEEALGALLPQHAAR